MKTYSTVLFAAVVLVGLMVTVGCGPSQQQYDELMARNKNAQDQLAQTAAALEEARARNQALQAQIDQRDAVIKAKDQEIALLTQARNELQKTVDELRALLGKGKDVLPPTVLPLPDSLNKALVELAKKYPDIFEFDPEKGMIKLKSDLTFAPGSTEVNPKAREALAKFAEVMNSADASGFDLYIVGHTDDMPISREETKKKHPTNWYLSVHRSVMVEMVLEKEKLSAQRMAVAGFSEYQPIAPNAAGNKGNEANRRVEIYIVPPNKMLGAASTGAK